MIATTTELSPTLGNSCNSAARIVKLEFLRGHIRCDQTNTDIDFAMD